MWHVYSSISLCTRFSSSYFAARLFSQLLQSTRRIHFKLIKKFHRRKCVIFEHPVYDREFKKTTRRDFRRPGSSRLIEERRARKERAGRRKRRLLEPL